MCALASACGAPVSPPVDAATSADALPDGAPGADVAASVDVAAAPDGALDATPGPDGAAPSDGGALRVTCSLAHGPLLVVTRPAEGASAPSTTLLRLPLHFSGAATQVRITSVVQRTAGMPAMDVRTWSAAAIRAPAGFTGAALPTPGNPMPVVTFTATADALALETAACDRASHERTGVVHVEGSTDAGPFALDCSLGGGTSDVDRLPFACARGVTGWLPTQSGSGELTSVRMPIVATLASSRIAVHNTGAAPVTGFVATGVTVTPRLWGPVPPGLMCAAPAPWEISSGRHTLWLGRTSSDVWSGPAEPGAEAVANWMLQLNGTTVPTGFCNVPSMGGGPTGMCPSVVNQFRLRGTSSAGAWEWEGAPFLCYERM